ncbi:MAG: asparaginase [Planctomycetia bacterium]|nr:asparaginase [Planctomycetia bacterium]
MSQVLVEVLRGSLVESGHAGSIAVADAAGGTLLAAGQADAPVFPRSAVKPLQALPLVASGAADHFGLTAAEIALASGSHGGGPAHVATAASMLEKAGCDEQDLACGSHWPLDDDAARALAARGDRPTPIHNNCSGKHAGFLCLARERGLDPRGYVRPEHAAMCEVTAALAAATREPLATVVPGIDGCSIPTFPLPLTALAAAWARFGTGDGLPAELAAAAARLRDAIRAHPEMVAGPGRFDTRIIQASRGAILVKSGAEGTVCAAIPAVGLGIAVKIADGAARAAQVALATVLEACGGSALDDATRAELAECASPVLKNWNGVEIGAVRPAEALRRHLHEGLSLP